MPIKPRGRNTVGDRVGYGDGTIYYVAGWRWAVQPGDAEPGEPKRQTED